MKNKNALAIFGVIFVNICWGLSFIGSKRSMAAGLQPFTLVMLRFAVTTVTLIPFALITKQELKIRLNDVPMMLLSALLGVTIYFYFELNGLKRTSAATASLIIAAIPVLTMAYNFVFRRRKLPALCWIGGVVSLFGVYLVVASDGGSDTVTGALYVLGACICWVGYMEVSDGLLKKYSSVTVTVWQSIFSLLTLAPLAVTEDIPWSSLPLDAWMWSCVFLGLICSAVCYILYNYAIAKLSTVTTSIFLNLNPVAAVVGGIFILGEKLVLKQYIGGIIIMAALFAVTRVKNGENA